MIEPTQSDIGRGVVYRARRLDAKPEQGVITSFNATSVFVRYGSDWGSKATARSDLWWMATQPVADLVRKS